MKFRLFPVFALSVFAAWLALPLSADQTPLKLADVLAWKRIQTPIVSNDGQWFAYKLTPNDGDAEVVVVNAQNGKEQRFPIGEMPRPNPFEPGAAPPSMAPPHDIAFSDDSKWLAFDEHPTIKEGKLLKKQHKPLETKVLLVELATGKKTEFERIKRFSFSGERSSAIALHRYPPAAQGPAAGAPATAAAAAPGATPPNQMTSRRDPI